MQKLLASEKIAHMQTFGMRATSWNLKRLQIQKVLPGCSFSSYTHSLRLGGISQPSRCISWPRLELNRAKAKSEGKSEAYCKQNQYWDRSRNENISGNQRIAWPSRCPCSPKTRRVKSGRCIIRNFGDNRKDYISTSPYILGASLQWPWSKTATRGCEDGHPRSTSTCVDLPCPIHAWHDLVIHDHKK